MADYEVLKASFFRAFANVAGPLRDEIIAFVDHEPFTWYTANAEIEQGTKKGKHILEQLHKIKVI